MVAFHLFNNAGGGGGGGPNNMITSNGALKAKLRVHAAVKMENLYLKMHLSRQSKKFYNKILYFIMWASSWCGVLSDFDVLK